MNGMKTNCPMSHAIGTRRECYYWSFSINETSSQSWHSLCLGISQMSYPCSSTFSQHSLKASESQLWKACKIICILGENQVLLHGNATSHCAGRAKLQVLINGVPIFIWICAFLFSLIPLGLFLHCPFAKHSCVWITRCLESLINHLCLEMGPMCSS